MKVFEDLVGKTITSIQGLEEGSEAVLFTLSDGTRCQLSHYQDCCESVSLYDVVGDVEDLIGEPILLARESSSGDSPPGLPESSESQTWTFYTIATRKGYVDMRWWGTSNGYYSESVTFEMMQ